MRSKSHGIKGSRGQKVMGSKDHEVKRSLNRRVEVSRSLGQSVTRGQRAMRSTVIMSKGHEVKELQVQRVIRSNGH